MVIFFDFFYVVVDFDSFVDNFVVNIEGIFEVILFVGDVVYIWVVDIIGIDLYVDVMFIEFFGSKFGFVEFVLVFWVVDIEVGEGVGVIYSGNDGL